MRNLISKAIAFINEQLLAIFIIAVLGIGFAFSMPYAGMQLTKLMAPSKPNPLDTYYADKAKQEATRSFKEPTLEERLQNCKRAKDCEDLAKLYEAEKAANQKLIGTEVKTLAAK